MGVRKFLTYLYGLAGGAIIALTILSAQIIPMVVVSVVISSHLLVFLFLDEDD